MKRVDIEANKPGNRVISIYERGLGWKAMEAKTWRNKRYKLEFLGKERPVDIINTFMWHFNKQSYPQIYGTRPSKTQRYIYFDTDHPEIAVLHLAASHIQTYVLIRSADQ